MIIVYINTLDIFGDGSAIAYYKLDSNGNDLNGSWNATVGSASSFSSTGGKFGGYATTTSGSQVGNNIRVENNTFANYFRPASTWSYSFWFKPSSSSTHRTINGSDCWWYFYTDDGGSAYVKAYHYSNGSTRNISAEGSYTNNGSTWQHMVVTNNPSGSTKVYVNNSLVASAGSTGSTANYTSGAYRVDINPSEGADAGSDHVRLFNKELSASEVAILYNEIG